MNTMNCPKCGTAINLVEQRNGVPGVLEVRHASADFERRSIEITELRVERAEGKPPKIVGHAAVFNQLSKPMTTPRGTKFREKISPGAFKRSLDSGRDIAGLYDHDRSKMLARTTSGKLQLSEDEKGLAFELTPPDTTLANDTMADIDHGNIRGMSFGFGQPVDEWEVVDGENIRTLKEIPLGEISLTPYPIYEGTDVNIRSVEAAVAKLEKRAMVEVDDPSIQYCSDYVLRSCQSTFDALRSLIRCVMNLGDAALTPADQSALSDAMDQVMDLDAKIACLAECTQGKYSPLNADPAAGGSRKADDQEVGNETVDAEDDDDDSERSFYELVQKMAEQGLDTTEIRAGHMTHKSNTPSLNADAEKHAMDLIKAGKVDDGKWTFTADDQTAMLGKNDWETYATWFLGINKNADAKSKGAYKYPFGKGEKVYVAAINAIRSRASQQSAKPIFDAAGRLLAAIKAKDAK